MNDLCAHLETDEPSSEPGSSIIDRGAVPSAYPGLEIDMDIVDSSLGGADQMATILATIVCAVFDQQLIADDVVAEVFVRIVGDDDSRHLNDEFRGKNYPTNVLSFPGCDPADIEPLLISSATGGPPVMLGDIVVAAPVVAKEAMEQGKTSLDHFCHLVTHGLLHLLGYDHIEDTQAENMEAIETLILANLGISNPYLLEPGHD